MPVILNVAEKHSVARELATVYSKGSMRKRTGPCRYTPLFDFKCMLAIPGAFAQEQLVDMVVTSVSGHLMGTDFISKYRGWQSCSPSDLFEAELERKLTSRGVDIEKSISNEGRRANVLIIWTDSDREGEAIGHDVAQVCKAVNPSIVVRRANFSANNAENLIKAMNSLGVLDQGKIQAAFARNEVDLRLGAVFTRFQTLGLQKRFPELSGSPVSFGPCQFPTLGFVVARAEEIQRFRPEQFWKIILGWTVSPTERCTFEWDRVKVFDHLAGVVLYENCVEAGEAVVSSLGQRRTSRWRPTPLSTLELLKQLSRCRGISSDITMKAAEKLYQKGLISYPRTETDFFEASFDLPSLVALHRDHGTWGEFATRLLDGGGFQLPRRGTQNDEAHPPIHPIKSIELASLSDNVERTVYEFVTRRFLACCSKDAIGAESSVCVEMGGETFHAKGTQILERNFLDVYIYTKWGECTIPNFQEGQVFTPSVLELRESTTTPPNFLTEEELIDLMKANGIGTDATTHEHINTIQERGYAVKRGKFIVPESLGFALIQGYKRIGQEDAISKPEMRAAMERGFAEISRGSKTREQVVRETVAIFRDVYRSTVEKSELLYQAINESYHNQPYQPGGGGPGNGPGGGGGGSGGDGGSGGGEQGGHRLDAQRNESNRTNRGPRAQLSNGERIKDYRTAKKGFTKCGICMTSSLDLRTTSREGMPGPKGGIKLIVSRLLYCGKCDGLYRLPQGKPEPSEHTCPLCQFGVVQITRDANKGSYSVCPKCFNSVDPIEDIARGVPCFKCTATNCTLARGTSDAPVLPCKACSDGMLRLKTTKKGSFMLSCSNYPKCNAVIWIAQTVSSVVLTKQNCPSCSSAKLLDLTFGAQSQFTGLSIPQRACPVPDCTFNPMELESIFRAAGGAGQIALPVSSSSRGSLEQKHTSTVFDSGCSSNTVHINSAEPSLAETSGFQSNAPQKLGLYNSFQRESMTVGPSLVSASNNPTSSHSTLRNNIDGSVPLCDQHQLPCISLQSSKQNENFGKWFFKCSVKPAPCNFFQWKDAEAMSTRPQHYGAQIQHASASNNSSSHLTCFKCGQPGHFANACPQLGQVAQSQARTNQSDINCFKCGQSGHYFNACPQVQAIGGFNSSRSAQQRLPSGGQQCFKCGQAGHYANSCPR